MKPECGEERHEWQGEHRGEGRRPAAFDAATSQALANAFASVNDVTVSSVCVMGGPARRHEPSGSFLLPMLRVAVPKD